MSIRPGSGIAYLWQQASAYCATLGDCVEQCPANHRLGVLK